MFINVVLVLIFSFVQNISFTMVSRSRNRDNITYHALCSVASNGVWFATMHFLVAEDLSFWLIMPYVLGTVSGSLIGAKISILIEKKIGTKT